ncbi:hypothetical protein PFAS1_13045 [Pseudomonas frederiksbergensis]|nr:hypothetical protein PFAS1_13045 [Pseudomonas frederiksbergensis]
MGMPRWTLCVRFGWDAERPGLHSHAERGNDHDAVSLPGAPDPANPAASSASKSAPASAGSTRR